MNATGIIWKDSISTEGAEQLGKCYEVFANNKYFLPKKKKAENRQVVMFKNAEDKVASVVMSSTVNDLFTEKKITLAQALTLNVIRFRGKGHDEDSMWLVLPAQGWKEMIEHEETNWEELAV